MFNAAVAAAVLVGFSVIGHESFSVPGPAHWYAVPLTGGLVASVATDGVTASAIPLAVMPFLNANPVFCDTRIVPPVILN